MALFTEREWTQTKDTEQLTFIAGQDLPYLELVKFTFFGSNVVISTTLTDAVGYVLSPKGALNGEKVDIQMLRSVGSGGPVTPSGVVIAPGCPQPTDDSTLGYIIGTEWYDTTRKALWISLVDTPGAAVWSEASNFHFDVVNPTVTDDFDACYFPGFKWWNDATQRFWLCVDATVGAAVWIDIGPGIVDVLIGRTLHVAFNGNDATAIPNSLVYKYLTIQAAHAASGSQDTIIIWPGTYTIPATIAIDGTHASRFYAYEGVAIITPPIGNPTFLIDPQMIFSFMGNGSWLVRSEIFAPSAPATDICTVDFEADRIGQFGVSGFFATVTSMRASIKIYHMTDLAIQCDGWCQVDMAIDKNEFTGAAQYLIANVANNNGLAYNVSYGVSRFQLHGREGKYAYIYGAYGPGFLDGIFSTGTGQGSRDDRKVKICADIYVFDGAAFQISEGSWTWEGSGFSEKDAPPVNDLYPFFLFNVDNIDFYFEHRFGSVNSIMDNTILQMNNNGTVKLAGNYYSLSEIYPLIKYDQGSISSRLILSGNYKTAGAIHVMEFNDLTLGTPFLPVFGEATVECLDTTVFIESTSGNPMNIYVEHSLISRTNYNAAIFTDLSVGNRHYVDRNFTNYIPNEFLR